MVNDKITDVKKVSLDIKNNNTSDLTEIRVLKYTFCMFYLSMCYIGIALQNVFTAWILSINEWFSLM